MSRNEFTISPPAQLQPLERQIKLYLRNREKYPRIPRLFSVSSAALCHRNKPDKPISFTEHPTLLTFRNILRKTLLTYQYIHQGQCSHEYANRSYFSDLSQRRGACTSSPEAHCCRAPNCLAVGHCRAVWSAPPLVVGQPRRLGFP